MEKVKLIGTGGAPHVNSHGVTFQAGKDDTLEFKPIVEGDAGINSTGVYVNNQPKCFINWSNNEYKDADVTYFDRANSKEYTFKLTNSNIHLN
tara:strand:+ start:1735 stop:2013 length:279 start_codon:yes stop_codon:yes gene_type:complete